MKREATLTLYKISECGLYREESHELAGARDVLSGLGQWVESLSSIGESATYTPNSDDDIMRAFCMDMREIKTHVYVFASWNEVPRLEDGMQVLSVNSKIGSASVSNVELDAMSLPGYPAYFVIDAANRKILNIRFDVNRLNGSRQLQQYIKGYIEGFSPWCLWDEDDPNKLLGYVNDETGEILDLESRFSTRLARNSTNVEFIKRNVHKIRKVIRRVSASPMIEEEKKFIERAFSFLGWQPNNRLRAPLGFQYEFKTKVTPEKLENMLEKYSTEADDKWSDVGFVMARESQKVHWLSGAIARRKIEVDVPETLPGVIDIDALSTFVEKNAEDLMAA